MRELDGEVVEGEHAVEGLGEEDHLARTVSCGYSHASLQCYHEPIYSQSLR
jgi:hypothetical protein